MIPFEAYAKLFLRVTNAVSRQQEFSADQLAARTVGANATISGLQKVHKYGLAFNAFFQQEYLPVIEAGYQPPMLGGFEIFLKAPRITEAVNNYYNEQLTEGKSDPYDTHPSLKERIAALQSLPQGKPVSPLKAVALLPRESNGLEGMILREIIIQKEKLTNLKEIGWDKVPEYAFLPQWEKTVETYKSILQDLTPSLLFDKAQNIPGIFTSIAKTGKILPPNVQPAQVPAEVQLQVTNNVIGAALASALNRAGWTIQTRPGEDLVFIKEKQELMPFSMFPQLASHQTSADQWRTICTENQISDLALA
jgi:hypothetical protein